MHYVLFLDEGFRIVLLLISGLIVEQLTDSAGAALILKLDQMGNTAFMGYRVDSVHPWLRFAGGGWSHGVEDRVGSWCGEVNIEEPGAEDAAHGYESPRDLELIRFVVAIVDGGGDLRRVQGC